MLREWQKKMEIAMGMQIRTVKQVRDDFEATKMVSLKEHQVRHVMKTYAGLSYKKIVRLAPRANCIENLISRQQCALLFLKLFKSKRRLINI